MPGQRRETKGIAECLRLMSQCDVNDWLIRRKGGAWMKAKRMTHCLGLKKTAFGTTRVEVRGASDASAGGLRPCSSDMIQAVKNHIFVIALSADPGVRQFLGPGPTQDSVFSVSMC
ncbi:MAG: hypothetical protein LBE61_21710 [Burkholderiaceae bacterium]|jgi:hypothetical protein|nr:hypothetical protein [Burkholderiaceae bacterium]